MEKYKFIGDPMLYNMDSKFQLTPSMILYGGFRAKNWDYNVSDFAKYFPDEWELVEEAKDNINPRHYNQGKVECIDALESATVDKKGIEAVCIANVIKYLWRYESKNGLEDIKKAKWYLNKLLSHLDDKIDIKFKDKKDE
jgi:hypothetical protein